MAENPSDLAGLEANAINAGRNVVAAKTHDEALAAAIEATEQYMKALSVARNATDKQRLQKTCKKALDVAEAVKSAGSWRAWRTVSQNGQPVTAGNERRRMPAEPVSRRALSTKEQIILLSGAKLNGFVFPPWKGPPDRGEFELEGDAELFEEGPRLRLSPSQLEHFAGWKRPKEALSLSVSDRGAGAASEVPTMQNAEAIDLVQDATSDCSVVASLCAGVARVQRGYSKLLSSIMFPYDFEGHHPALSPNGKYILKLQFNGCARKVVIDDCLPCSTNSRALHVIDRQDPSLLWPALIEKAYLKVRGGYDFPGSNSGTDLSVLTGWIPEQIFLHSTDVLPDQLWRRIEEAFATGDVLLTIGTGKLTKREQKSLGLAGEHDYAILDMKGMDGERKFLIKNPWSDGDSWKQKAQSGEVSGISPNEKNRSSKEPGSSDLLEHTLTPGTFWMDFTSVFQYFENLYLNWNPSRFTYREDAHFTWDLSSSNDQSGNFSSNPQFAITVNQGGEVWLLLSKHFKTGDYHRTYEGYHKIGNGFISLYVFKRDGERVFLSDGAFQHGQYVDSPNTLLKLELPAATSVTAVVAQQALQQTEYNFSLSIFSKGPAKISPADNKYGYKKNISAVWTRSTAGGNSESPDYPKNPQFKVSVFGKSILALLLGTSDSDVAVHVKVFSTNGSRISHVRARDIVCDSGGYRQGCAVAEAVLDKGSYTIVCSTFTRGQLGSFNLCINCSTDCVVQPLPAEAAGRLSVKSDPAVFRAGVERLLAPLITPRYVRVRFIARPFRPPGGSDAVAISPLRMSVERGQGPYKEIIATSNHGEFSDSLTGVRLEDMDLSPTLQQRGGLWLVVERLGSPQAQRGDFIEIETLAECEMHIGKWGRGDG